MLNIHKYASYTVKQEIDWLDYIFKAEKDSKGKFWTIDRKIEFFTGFINACQIPAKQWNEQDDAKLIKTATKHLIMCERMKEGGSL